MPNTRTHISKRSRRVAYLALFAALTLVLGYLETMIPLPVTIPGVKLGLANITVLIVLYLMGPRWAGITMLLKIVITSFIIGSPSMILFSFAGSMLAFAGMLVLWRVKTLNLIAVSVVSALLHNLGQLFVAIIVMNSLAIIINLPIMILAACVTGVMTGTVAKGVLRSLSFLRNEEKRQPSLTQ